MDLSEEASLAICTGALEATSSTKITSDRTTKTLQAGLVATPSLDAAPSPLELDSKERSTLLVEIERLKKRVQDLEEWKMQQITGAKEASAQPRPGKTKEEEEAEEGKQQTNSVDPEEIVVYGKNFNGTTLMKGQLLVGATGTSPAAAALTGIVWRSEPLYQRKGECCKEAARNGHTTYDFVESWGYVCPPCRMSKAHL